jgi:hypothetical protein
MLPQFVVILQSGKHSAHATIDYSHHILVLQLAELLHPLQQGLYYTVVCQDDLSVAYKIAHQPANLYYLLVHTPDFNAIIGLFEKTRYTWRQQMVGATFIGQ